MPVKSIDVIKNNCKNTYDASKETIAQIALEISGHPKCDCNNYEADYYTDTFWSFAHAQRLTQAYI